MSGIREHIEDCERQEMVFEEEIGSKTGAEIAKELGITRQAVSNTLKRAMAKVYAETRKLEKGWTPFEVAAAMSIIFNVEEIEIAKFFKLFPPKIRKEIENDALKRMPGIKK